MAPAVLALPRHPVLKNQNQIQETTHQGRHEAHGGEKEQNRAHEALEFEAALVPVQQLSVPLEDD